MTTPYPLAWPATMPRAKSRDSGRFQTSLATAIKNVQGSLRLFASDSGKALSTVVVSSNVTLGTGNPTDPGVAVWFVWDGLSLCIPVDRYAKVEANLQAIHHIIEARRVELRHGSLALVRASFTGFIALSAPAESASWRKVLGIPDATAVTKGVVESYFRAAAKTAHPDHGGSSEKMAAVNDARAKALQELDHAR